MDAGLGTPRVRGPSRARVVLIGSLLVALLLGSAYAVASTVFGVGLFGRPFDHGRWTAADDGRRETRRGRMVRNLVKRHLATGMTRAEVEALLGPPDPDPALAPRAPGDWIYELGATPWESLRLLWWTLTDRSDPESPEAFEEVSEILTLRALMIGFDADGRVDRFEIVEI